MKTKFLAMLLSLAVINFSCDKDDDDVVAPPVTYNIAGLWIGTYTVNQLPNQTPLYYNFSIKPDGKILSEGKGSDGKSYYHQGTWTLNGITFTATYSTINSTVGVVTQSATLTFNADKGTLTDGTWTDVVNPNGHLDGKFQTLTRVN